MDEAPATPGAEGGDGQPEPSPEEDRWPVGFILTITLVGLYLGYRLIQGVVLLFEWIF